jgi:hypothetical protein
MLDPDPDPNPVLEPGSEIVMHSGNGSAKAKSYGSCGSGSTTVVISPQTLQKKNLGQTKTAFLLT